MGGAAGQGALLTHGQCAITPSTTSCRSADAALISRARFRLARGDMLWFSTADVRGGGGGGGAVIFVIVANAAIAAADSAALRGTGMLLEKLLIPQNE